MRRLLLFALLLGAVNLVGQIVVVLAARHADLSFGAFAGLVLIPLFQGTILVLASPEPGRITTGAALRSIVRDRAALALTVAAFAAAIVLARMGTSAAWRAVFVTLLVCAGCLAMACFLRLRGPGGTPLLVAGVISWLFAVEISYGLLAAALARLQQFPRALVLLVAYGTLLALTIAILLSVSRVMRDWSPPASRVVEASVAMLVAGALIVAGNYFHHPLIAERWLLAVRLLAFFALAGVLVACALQLRHDRGGDEQAV